ncbi:MAG: pilus assembly protein [Chloroflexi bacterium]|nr:pilus assembly protein [Chloroflexota bacterium]
MKHIKQLHKGNRGAVAVEFAILVPILLLIVFGIFVFGQAFSYWVDITNAAREGARAGAVYNNDYDIRQTACQRSGLVDSALCDPDVSGTLDVVTTNAGGAQGTAVQVRVTYQFDVPPIPLINVFFSSDPYPLTATATMRLE